LSDLASRYLDITTRVASAASACSRNPSEIKLIVVTKNHPSQLVLDLLDLGARDFGENRDQEANTKASQVRNESAISHNWHFIGQLQTNKVKSVLEYADFIHSLDRQSLLDELIKRTASRSAKLGVFIQVNLTDDPLRGGVNESDLESFAQQVLECQQLELRGLMGVAGLDVTPESEFQRMADLSAKLLGIAPLATGLSMGMSQDFESAISYGATHLRIGTAITGNRPA
jgi:pyridoxal phosphate enzyme (YggS family)